MRDLFHFYKNKPEWMQECCDQLRIFFQENKMFSLFISYLIFTTFLLFLENHRETSMNALQAKHDTTILRELKNINTALQVVENNPNNTKQQQDILQGLEKNILNVQKSMADFAKTRDIENIALEISSAKDEIGTQLHDIKKTISENSNSKEYLDASTLPFHIISVDVISGQPYVSVQYANHVSPLSIGDELAGWRVISADYESTVSEFVNDKNQHIKVSLQGIAT